MPGSKRKGKKRVVPQQQNTDATPKPHKGVEWFEKPASKMSTEDWTTFMTTFGLSLCLTPGPGPTFSPQLGVVPAREWSEVDVPRKLVSKLCTRQFDNQRLTPEQMVTLPLILSGRSCVYGGGSASSFVAPLVSCIYKIVTNPMSGSCGGPYAVVLCPTRMLAEGANHCIRGMCSILGLQDDSPTPNIAPHYMVTTTGGLLDHLRNRRLSLKHCKFIVLCSADKISALGFNSEIKEIISELLSVYDRTALPHPWNTGPPCISAFCNVYNISIIYSLLSPYVALLCASVNGGDCTQVMRHIDELLIPRVVAFLIGHYNHRVGSQSQLLLLPDYITQEIAHLFSANSGLCCCSSTVYA
ncbi:hypothetical protein Pelo_5757 [Pelomyxa schiedti]|nr:hypothetical protein Pelo_5757 [Pelomyxa schiedti]